MEQNNTDTALLVIDMQTGILAMLPDTTQLLENTANAIAHARKNNIPVIYVVVGFRKGAPEVSLNNKSFGGGKERFANTNMDEFMTVHPALAPQEGEATATKRRVSAFTGSDVEVLLRANNIRHIVLAGVATSGAILSTVREAADKDLKITVLADCCADHDEEVHRVLTTKIFPRQADVMTTAAWNH